MQQIELKRKQRLLCYNEPWGFSYKGGNNSPLIVTEVKMVIFKIFLVKKLILFNQIKKDSPADGKLKIDDEIIQIGSKTDMASVMSIDDLNDLIDNNLSLKLTLKIKRFFYFSRKKIINN